MTPSAALMRKMATEATIGQLITSPLISYFLYPTFTYFGMYELDAPLPDFPSLMKTFVIGHMFNDIGFYWTHRLFHCKALYKRWVDSEVVLAAVMNLCAPKSNHSPPLPTSPPPHLPPPPTGSTSNTTSSQELLVLLQSTPTQLRSSSRTRSLLSAASSSLVPIHSAYGCGSACVSSRLTRPTQDTASTATS